MDLIGGHLPELIILLIVILIIWGPGKLPDLGAAVGRGIREFRNASAETRESVQNAMTTPVEPVQPAVPAESEPVVTPGGPSTPDAG
jgi:TatA/E family protein of Tat protein translocase